MKPLVVFYSRTGTTKQVGEALVQMLDCDSEELLDTKKRSGPLGFLLAGRDAQTKKLTTLTDIKHDPVSYDLVILGTPVWGGTESQQLFDEMEALCERHPIKVLALPQKEVKNGAYQDKLRQFADGLQAP